MSLTTLAHFTLNTGDLQRTPRTGVAPEAISYLDPLVSGARQGARINIPVLHDNQETILRVQLLFGKERCFLQISCHGQPPCLLCLLAWSEDAGEVAVAALANAARRAKFPVVEAPHESPILAVLVCPSALSLPGEILAAAADLERCLAWTILAQEGLCS